MRDGDMHGIRFDVSQTPNLEYWNTGEGENGKFILVLIHNCFQQYDRCCHSVAGVWGKSPRIKVV